jgi:hypothetical protein
VQGFYRRRHHRFELLEFLSRAGLGHGVRRRPICHENARRLERSKPPGETQIRALMSGLLKHPEHDGADKGECDIRGYNAQFADKRTDESHWEGSLVHVAAH